ncbi:MAG: hypothetical protein GAK31_01987 [Stenotrophomonas maltophilia]|uniref:Glycosyltransferase RgtA/B/C/D-like domain-containing protein n=1 Tax=Stenotrophomonas maltophilia TaxID=40324 RepID=A0A7V8FFB3_STEMA|nr:MAG: hypothetical protein GAK31_01987 [Stenotrophomonas maltophilia]
MMESTAVFFGLVFVWAMATLRNRARWWVGLLGIVAAVLSALLKVTTFFGFAAFVALALAWLAVREHGWRPQWLRQQAPLLAWGALSALAVLLLTVWLHHADALKAQSVLGQQVTSGALSTWNYGTLQQKLSADSWWGTVLKKRFGGAVGSNWVFLLFLVAGLSLRQTRAATAVLVLAYLAPFLVFTNLHIAHPYYQAANIVFATSIVGLVLWAVTVRAEAAGKPRRALALAVLLCLLSTGFGLAHYLKNMKEARAPTQVSKIAALIDPATPASGVVVACGQDWSSELPYVSGRRALMVPDWASDDALKALAGSDAALGGLPLAALVECPNQIGHTPARAAWLAQIRERYAAAGERREVAGCVVWLHPR